MLFLPLSPNESVSLGPHGEHKDTDKLGQGKEASIPASPTLAIEAMMDSNGFREKKKNGKKSRDKNLQCHIRRICTKMIKSCWRCRILQYCNYIISKSPVEQPRDPQTTPLRWESSGQSTQFTR